MQTTLRSQNAKQPIKLFLNTTFGRLPSEIWVRVESGVEIRPMLMVMLMWNNRF